MPNTSATGGYLVHVLGPVDGDALRRFIGLVLVGISGLAPDMVRPAWQQNSPPIPGIEIDWLAFGIIARRADNEPYQVEKMDGSAAVMIRHEELEIQLIFYGPNCLAKAAEVRDGFEVAQNCEALYLAGMAFIDLTDIIRAPELVNGRYFDRCDATLTIRREVRRDYPILNFVSASGTLLGNHGGTTLSVTWST